MKEMSVQDARKISIYASRIYDDQVYEMGIQGVREVINHLGYVQIDSISTIKRAYHHILWTRLPDYCPDYLEQLVNNQEIFEYWFHAAAYLPMDAYRFCLPMMQRVKEEGRFFFKGDEPILSHVYEYVKKNGPLTAKDIQPEDLAVDVGTKKGSSRNIKYALDTLFLNGSLMVKSRENFKKVFDLTERVLPEDVDMRLPDDSEMAEYQLKLAMRVHGIIAKRDVIYKRPEGKKALTDVVKRYLQEKKLVKVKIKDINKTYLVRPDILELDLESIYFDGLFFLSPFDHLVINRKRLQELFDFDYVLECYKPKSKVKYGYFTLPILYNGQFIGLMDSKADKKKKKLEVKSLHIFCEIENQRHFQESFHVALKRFAKFQDCKEIEYQNIYPETYSFLSE